MKFKWISWENNSENSSHGQLHTPTVHSSYIVAFYIILINPLPHMLYLDHNVIFFILYTVKPWARIARVCGNLEYIAWLSITLFVFLHSYPCCGGLFLQVRITGSVNLNRPHNFQWSKFNCRSKWWKYKQENLIFEWFWKHWKWRIS